MAASAGTSMEKLQSSPAWSRIRDEFYATGDAAALQNQLTGVIDTLSIEAFDGTLRGAFPKGIAMLAVGGYGRRELFPYSDIDIMILLENESLTVAIKDSLSEFMRQLWDSGLRLSHSVRTVNDCAEVHDQNPELNISLLDRRMLAGDVQVHAKLEARLPLFFTKQNHRLTRHLCQLTRTRHGKYQDTLYHLEPDVKETPGGLRDLHFIHWISGLRPELRPEAPLAEATAFLSSLRCFLHFEGFADRNILNFEAQEKVVQQRFSKAKTPTLWMREYFSQAGAVFREAQRTLDGSEKSETSLFSSLRNMRSRVSNPEFTVSSERVFLRNPAHLQSDPETVLRLLEFVARHGVPLAAESERRLEAARGVFAEWCRVPRPLWPQIKVW